MCASGFFQDREKMVHTQNWYSKCRIARKRICSQLDLGHSFYLLYAKIRGIQAFLEITWEFRRVDQDVDMLITDLSIGKRLKTSTFEHRE